jgi:hypothetical protein
LHKQNTGPWLVLCKTSPVNYRVQRTADSKSVIVHVDRLARYYSATELPTWLTLSTGEHVSSSTQTNPVLEQEKGTITSPKVLRPVDSDAQDCDDRGTEPKSPKRLREQTGPRQATRKKREKRKGRSTIPLRRSSRLQEAAIDNKHRNALVWAQPPNDRGRPPSISKRPQRNKRVPDRY